MPLLRTSSRAAALLGSLALGCTLAPDGTTAFGEPPAPHSTDEKPTTTGGDDTGDDGGDGVDDGLEGGTETGGDSGTTGTGDGDGDDDEDQDQDQDQDQESETGSQGDASDGGVETGEESTGGEEVEPPATSGEPAEGMPEITGVCDGEAIDVELGAFGGPDELIVLGVYEPAAATVTVGLDRPGPALTLMLSSYEPVAWQLELAEGTWLDEVIVSAYGTSTVDGHGGATVTSFGEADYLGCGYVMPSMDGGCETELMVATAEAMTGNDLAAFGGCYRAFEFDVQ